MTEAQQPDPQRLGAWLHSHDTGISSEAIFHYMTLGITGGGTPHDPADLGRCLRLLDKFPEWKPRMPEMAEVGGMWPTYVKHWDRMASMMADEVGIDWSKGTKAPRTYAFMKEVYDEAYAARTDGVKTIQLGSGASVSFRA